MKAVDVDEAVRDAEALARYCECRPDDAARLVSKKVLAHMRAMREDRIQLLRKANEVRSN
jgi:hypothetical protein